MKLGHLGRAFLFAFLEQEWWEIAWSIEKYRAQSSFWRMVTIAVGVRRPAVRVGVSSHVWADSLHWRHRDYLWLMQGERAAAKAFGRKGCHFLPNRARLDRAAVLNDCGKLRFHRLLCEIVGSVSETFLTR